MTCGECELLLGQDEISEAVQAHLAVCPDCRSLAAELQANTDAMRALGEEVVPPVTILTRGTPWWKWSSAAAALIITLGAAWWASRPPKPPQMVSVDVKVTGVAPTTVPMVPAKIPDTLTPVAHVVTNDEPLRVKMLTPDPDVVIYWLID
jgi:hypothetical protein